LISECIPSALILCNTQTCVGTMLSILCNILSAPVWTHGKESKDFPDILYQCCRTMKVHRKRNENWGKLMNRHRRPTGPAVIRVFRQHWAGFEKDIQNCTGTGNAIICQSSKKFSMINCFPRSAWNCRR
jgi:hypothetical protein